MTASGAWELERITARDLSQNVTLSRSVGWHDVESEWRVLHAAADVFGAWHEGRLVAQGALGHYGTAASLAKMVVAPELQRRGLGARLLDHFLEQADARGAAVGLCATDYGRPLYATRGFEVSGELVILFGQAELKTTAVDSQLSPLDVETAVEQDRMFAGCDRGRVLRARFAEASAAYALRGRRGFGLATLQGENALLGPIWAEDPQDGQLLCEALLATLARPARVDVPLEQVELRRRLVQLGLREMSVRVEMARGTPRLPWQTNQRFALSTQAWG